MTFTRTERNVLPRSETAMKFADDYCDRLKRQNAEYKRTEDTVSITIEVVYQISVSDESINDN